MPSFICSGLGAKQALMKCHTTTVPAFVYTAHTGQSAVIDGVSVLSFQWEQIGLENTAALGLHSPAKDPEAHGVEVSQLPQTDDLGSCQSISQHPIAGILVFPRSFPKCYSAPRWDHFAVLPTLHPKRRTWRSATR